MAEEIIVGGGRVPQRAGFFRRWGRRLVWAITLGAVGVGAAGGYHHRRELLRMGNENISAPAMRIGREAYYTYSEHDQRVMAAMPGSERKAMIKAGALRDEVISIANSVKENVSNNYSSRGRRKRGIKDYMGKVISSVLRAEQELLKGGDPEKKKAAARKLLAEAAIQIQKADQLIDLAPPAEWPGEDREDAKRNVSRLRTLIASIMAVLGL